MPLRRMRAGGSRAAPCCAELCCASLAAARRSQQGGVALGLRLRLPFEQKHEANEAVGGYQLKAQQPVGGAVAGDEIGQDDRHCMGRGGRSCKSARQRWGSERR